MLIHVTEVAMRNILNRRRWSLRTELRIETDKQRPLWLCILQGTLADNDKDEEIQKDSKELECWGILSEKV